MATATRTYPESQGKYTALQEVSDFKMAATVLSWPNFNDVQLVKDALDDFQEVADTDGQAASWGEKEVHQL